MSVGMAISSMITDAIIISLYCSVAISPLGLSKVTSAPRKKRATNAIKAKSTRINIRTELLRLSLFLRFFISAPWQPLYTVKHNYYNNTIRAVAF